MPPFLLFTGTAIWKGWTSQRSFSQQCIWEGQQRKRGEVRSEQEVSRPREPWLCIVLIVTIVCLQGGNYKEIERSLITCPLRPLPCAVCLPADTCAVYCPIPRKCKRPSHPQTCHWTFLVINLYVVLLSYFERSLQVLWLSVPESHHTLPRGRNSDHSIIVTPETEKVSSCNLESSLPIFPLQGLT